ncbi:MAG: hypothetical protein ACRDRL_13270 [Sciscionella sp.]
MSSGSFSSVTAASLAALTRPRAGYSALLLDELERALAGHGTGVTAHDRRPFFASALIALGVSVKPVQTVLGHSSAVITLRAYSHLWPGEQDRTRSIVDATLGILRTGCGLAGLGNGVTAGQGGR